MKPITVILPGGGTWSMSADEGRTLAEQILRACDAVAPETIDPTPMPAPALGMRVWCVGGPDANIQRPAVDVVIVRKSAVWSDYVDSENITLITDFRTGEVLWRKQ